MMTLVLIGKATAAILAAGALDRLLLRRGSAAQRHFIWTLAFAALLALPWLPGFRPGPAALWFAHAASGATPVANATAGVGGLLRWIWLAGVVAALLRLALGHLRMARTAEVPAAMTWGILRPLILAPAAGLHEFDRRHEEAHVARRDGLWQFIAQLACAVYWFHPLVWWAGRRAAQERERACDDIVLASGIEPASYAQRLVDAARLLAAPPLAALAVSGESGLATRVEAILDPAVNRRRLRLLDLVCGLAAGGLLLFSLAPLAAQPAAGSTKPRMIYRVEPEYTDEARAALIAGPVHLTAVVLPDGSFSDVKVESGIGYGLDEKAVEAIEQWRAAPAERNGEPVAADVKIEVNFRLE